MNYTVLPIMFLKFWFLESPLALIQFFLALNGAFLQLFSLPLFLKTFFKPLKNEYRQGLVGFSIGMGMFVKTFFIIADLFILLVLLSIEIVIVGGYIFFPFATIWLLFWK